MSEMRVLVTCPPMLGMIGDAENLFRDKGIELTCPHVTQTLSEQRLMELVPSHDGWIIGDDPATWSVFEAGRRGRLKAAVKWGVGVDNVDFAACREFGIKIVNTPGMFGAEVADVALGYVIALARETFDIDRRVRAGEWPKNRGISLAGKTVGLIGYGDIGRNTAMRLSAVEMRVLVFDPVCAQIPEEGAGLELAVWPQRVGECDFLVFTCQLNESTRHMLDADVFAQCKDSVRVVNVARGPIIEQEALVQSLRSGKTHSVALDVFEREPLSMESPLRSFPLCIFGSHNASNTAEAVIRTNHQAIDCMFEFLGV